MDRVLEELKKEELVTITSEEFFGLVAYIISLTSKGVTLHHKLLRIEEYLSTPSYEMPSNFTVRFKNLSALTHFNVKDDHVALTEHNFDGAGNDRIVYVYTRPNGHNFMRLWCDADGTFSCPHTEYALDSSGSPRNGAAAFPKTCIMLLHFFIEYEKMINCRKWLIY